MTLSMKADIKERWIAELRSGNYRQGQGDLHWIGPVGLHQREGERFCCLGVLSKMCAEDGAVEVGGMRDSYSVSYGATSETAYLPAEVIAWAGLKFEGERAFTTDRPLEESRGIISQGTRANEFRDDICLSRMNDSGAPFEQIAQVIEDEIVGV